MLIVFQNYVMSLVMIIFRNISIHASTKLKHSLHILSIQHTLYFKSYDIIYYIDTFDDVLFAGEG